MTEVLDPATPAADPAAAPANDPIKSADSKPDTSPATLAGGTADGDPARDAKPADARADPDPVKDAKADASFPDNWREMMAGDNKALLNTLKRYASPKSWTDAAFALRQKISTGELKSTLPKDATPEQVSEWRKDNGVPDKPEDYDLALPGGLVIGEADRPLVGEFLKEMHGTNATPDQVKSALTAYYTIQQNLIRDTEEADGAFKVQSEDALRSEWGGDFRKNVNLVTGVLDTLPQEVADRIAFARTPEGRKLGDDPDFLRAMSKWALDMGMDSGASIPAPGSDAMKSLDAEKATLEKAMNTRAYTPAMRERYAEILDVEARQKQRK